MKLTEEQFQDICHDLTPADALRFRAGCVEHWKKLGFPELRAVEHLGEIWLLDKASFRTLLEGIVEDRVVRIDELGVRLGPAIHTLSKEYAQLRLYNDYGGSGETGDAGGLTAGSGEEARVHLHPPAQSTVGSGDPDAEAGRGDPESVRSQSAAALPAAVPAASGEPGDQQHQGPPPEAGDFGSVGEVVRALLRYPQDAPLRRIVTHFLGRTEVESIYLDGATVVID